jgi:hypothetical protein
MRFKRGITSSIQILPKNLKIVYHPQENGPASMTLRCIQGVNILEASSFEVNADGNPMPNKFDIIFMLLWRRWIQSWKHNLQKK